MSKHLLRLILWLTKPTMLRGATLATIFWLLVALAWSFERGANALMLLLAVCVLLLIGAILGRRLADRAAGELKTQAMEPARKALGAISDALAVQDPDHRREALLQAFRSAVPRLAPLAGMAWGGLMTFLAMGSLIAVLGVTVAFASFLATYMQVERQDTQIQLSKLQSISAHQQVAKGMRDEIAGVRIQEAKAYDLYLAFEAASSPPDTVAALCGNVRADVPLLELVELLVEGKRPPIKEDFERLCFFTVTGTSLRLQARLQDADLWNVELASGFPSVCGTSTEDAVDFTRRWEALKTFVAAAVYYERTEGIATDGSEDPESAPPTHLSIPAAAMMLGDFTGKEMSSLLQAAGNLPKIVADLQGYLLKQHTACQERAISRTELLAELDQQYLSMLPQDVQERSARAKAQRAAARDKEDYVLLPPP